MIRLLTDFLGEINENIISNTEFGSKITAYNDPAELYVHNGRTHPQINQGTFNGVKLALDFSKNLQIYYRVIDSDIVTDGFGKGRKQNRYRVYLIRLVGIGYYKNLLSRDHESNYEIEALVQSAIPSKLSGNEVITITDEIVNKSIVLQEEFSGLNTDELKKLNLESIAFAIEFELKYRIDCGEYASVPLTCITSATSASSIVGAMNDAQKNDVALLLFDQIILLTGNENVIP